MLVAMWTSVVILAIGTVVALIWMIKSDVQLKNYLINNHFETWKYLTSIGKFGPGIANTVNILGFVFGKDTLNDPVVTKYKVSLRNSGICFVSGVFATFINIFIIVIFRFFTEN